MKIQSLKRWAAVLVLGAGSTFTFSVNAANGQHNPNHPNHADCVRTNALNSSGAIVSRVTGHSRKEMASQNFYRAANKVLANKNQVQRITKAHNPNHEGHAMCVQTNVLNTQGPIVKRVSFAKEINTKGSINSDKNFIRQAQAALQVGRVNRVTAAHNPNHVGHDQCIVVNKLNSSGKAVRIVRK